MTWHNVRRAIRDSVASDPRSGAPPAGRKALRETRSTGAIGWALRRLHEPTVDEPLPREFACLLEALDAAEGRGRA